MAVFVSPKADFRSDRNQLENRVNLKYEKKSLQEGVTTLPQASHNHLLITPPSHFILQRVRGWLGRFFVNN
jgi:hypothetical protein